MLSLLFFSCVEPDEVIETAYKREFSFFITNNCGVEHKVTAVRLCQRNGEWYDLFSTVPDKKDATATVAANGTAFIDDFPLNNLEYVEPWSESFLLQIDDDFYLGSPKSDNYSEDLHIDESKIKKDNLHSVKITASTETPSISGSLEPKKTKGIYPNELYYDFSEIISVVINDDDVVIAVESVEF